MPRFYALEQLRRMQLSRAASRLRRQVFRVVTIVAGPDASVSARLLKMRRRILFVPGKFAKAVTDWLVGSMASGAFHEL
jgi:hypothetical protein